MNHSETKTPPSRVDVWTKAHKKKNGELVNSEVAEAFVYTLPFQNHVTFSFNLLICLNTFIDTIYF